MKKMLMISVILVFLMIPGLFALDLFVLTVPECRKLIAADFAAGMLKQAAKKCGNGCFFQQDVL